MDSNSIGLATPVALFIYNRPDTTEQVFNQIRRVKPLKLLIVADGPRQIHVDDAARCAAARRIVDEIDWPCEVRTNFADHNMGCGRRISSGLNWVFEQVEAAIILEDDCVPQPGFFHFCEALLYHYWNDERIMLVSGSNMVDQVAATDSYLFSRWYNIWGWATWRRAWQLYDFDMADWPDLRQRHLLECIYPVRYVRSYLQRSFDLAHAHKIDTWDIQWFYTCLRSSGLSIVPKVNLVANIGTVGTHTQMGHEGPRPTGTLAKEPLHHPRWVHVHPEYDRAFYAARIRPTLRTEMNRWAVAFRRRLQV